MASGKQDQKDPAHTAAERLAELICVGAKDEIARALDSNVHFNSITGDYFGVPSVCQALIEFYTASNGALTAEPTQPAKDMKTASTVFNVAGMRFEDVITINHSLLVTKIVRTRIASKRMTDA
eukprot:Sspe_Gene.21090::Locus_7846_Transcript_1_1_Confidence_1.000_Length_677::g.21090::m.21090